MINLYFWRAESGDREVNPSYFKFENMWLKSDGFMENIEEWWNSYTIHGSPDYILIQKLRLLKKDISCWNKEVFGKVESRKSKVLDELLVLEQITENRVQTVGEKSKMFALKLESEQIEKLRRFHGDRSPGAYGSKKEIGTPNTFNELRTPIEEIIALTDLWLILRLLKIRSR